jgi:hypothetical protein
MAFASTRGPADLLRGALLLVGHSCCKRLCCKETLLLHLAKHLTAGLFSRSQLVVLESCAARVGLSVAGFDSETAQKSQHATATQLQTGVAGSQQLLME